MIPKERLKWLSHQRILDAEILVDNERYLSALYLSGYAIEVALKYNICKMYSFGRGFPENNKEFLTYEKRFATMENIPEIIKELKDIRHHNLSELLKYSGREKRVKENSYDEWENVSITWNPQMRYHDATFPKDRAINFVNDVKKIVSELL